MSTINEMTNVKIHQNEICGESQVKLYLYVANSQVSRHCTCRVGLDRVLFYY